MNEKGVALQEVEQWSVITVTYNSAATLREYWVTSLPKGAEWIVVDNNSSDGSADLAEELGAKVIRLRSNVGFSAANNVGFRASDRKYIMFANPDVRVIWKDLAFLSRAVDCRPSLVAPQLTNPDSSSQPNGRLAPSLKNKVLNRLRGARPHSLYRVTAEKEETRYVTWLTGAVIASSREIFNRLDGPWNEVFFLYHEDADLSLRAWKLDISVLVIGEIRWVHGWARETSKLALRAWKRELSSAAKFYALYPAFIFGRHAPAELRKASLVWGGLAEDSTRQIGSDR